MGRCRLARSRRGSCVRRGRLAAKRKSSLASIESRSRGKAEGQLLHSDVLLHLNGARAAQRPVAPVENGGRLSHSNVLVLRRHLRGSRRRTPALASGAVSTTYRPPIARTTTCDSGTPLAPVSEPVSAVLATARRFLVVQDRPRASLDQEDPSDE
jgi:hypothetical protein